MYYKYPKKMTERKRLIAFCNNKWRKIINPYNVCALCKSKNKVQAHHIIKKGVYPHVGWWLIENGIPLCWEHHYRGTHSAYFKDQEVTQKIINRFLRTKGTTYDKLYYKCKGTNQRIDVSYLQIVKMSLIVEYDRLKKKNK